MSMNRIVWNPWHGCHKCSTGCENCYIFEMDEYFGKDTNQVKINSSQYYLPIQMKNMNGHKGKSYKVPGESVIMTCMSSDFFIEEADFYREHAWEIIHERKDCLFEIMTKRPERIKQCLPYNWLDGWYNVKISVSIEDNETAWQRIPELLDSPVKHMGIVVIPMLEKIDIREFIGSGFIETVIAGGENCYNINKKPRELQVEWIKDLKKQCEYFNVAFKFVQTGTLFKDRYDNTVKVRRRKDQKNLAQFYDLDYFDDNTISWEKLAQQLDEQFTIELSQEVYYLIHENEKENSDRT